MKPLFLAQVPASPSQDFLVLDEWFRLTDLALQGIAESEAQGYSDFTFTWITGEGSGPSVTEFVLQVLDNGAPRLGAIQKFKVTIGDANAAPVLDPIANQTINEGRQLSIPSHATDADLPRQASSWKAATRIWPSLNSRRLATSWRRPPSSQWNRPHSPEGEAVVRANLHWLTMRQSRLNRRTCYLAPGALIPSAISPSSS